LCLRGFFLFRVRCADYVDNVAKFLVTAAIRDRACFMPTEDKTLNKIIDHLVREFHPRKIFLFGSRANGAAGADSDYDLMLVVDKHEGRLAAMRRATQVLGDIHAGVDVFIYDQKEFDELKTELSSIPETALNTGREIDLG
jgi:uncharacterized protein